MSDKKKLTDCVYFGTQKCTNRNCQFRHNPVATSSTEDCQKWLNGDCENVSCPLKHPTKDKDYILRRTCRYFSLGNCTKGSECNFLHVKPDGLLANSSPHGEESIINKANRILRREMSDSSFPQNPPPMYRHHMNRQRGHQRNGRFGNNNGMSNVSPLDIYTPLRKVNRYPRNFRNHFHHKNNHHGFNNNHNRNYGYGRRRNHHNNGRTYYQKNKDKNVPNYVLFAKRGVIHTSSNSGPPPHNALPSMYGRGGLINPEITNNIPQNHNYHQPNYVHPSPVTNNSNHNNMYQQQQAQQHYYHQQQLYHHQQQYYHQQQQHHQEQQQQQPPPMMNTDNKDNASPPTAPPQYDTNVYPSPQQQPPQQLPYLPPSPQHQPQQQPMYYLPPYSQQTEQQQQQHQHYQQQQPPPQGYYYYYNDPQAVAPVQQQQEEEQEQEQQGGGEEESTTPESSEQDDSVKTGDDDDGQQQEQPQEEQEQEEEKEEKNEEKKDVVVDDDDSAQEKV